MVRAGPSGDNTGIGILAKVGHDGVEWRLSHFNPRTGATKELRDAVRITKWFFS